MTSPDIGEVWHRCDNGRLYLTLGFAKRPSTDEDFILFQPWLPTPEEGILGPYIAETSWWDAEFVVKGTIRPRCVRIGVVCYKCFGFGAIKDKDHSCNKCGNKGYKPSPKEA